LYQEFIFITQSFGKRQFLLTAVLY